jgi:hypothetical protein
MALDWAARTRSLVCQCGRCVDPGQPVRLRVGYMQAAGHRTLVPALIKALKDRKAEHIKVIVGGVIPPVVRFACSVARCMLSCAPLLPRGMCPCGRLACPLSTDGLMAHRITTCFEQRVWLASSVPAPPSPPLPSRWWRSSTPTCPSDGCISRGFLGCRLVTAQQERGKLLVYQNGRGACGAPIASVCPVCTGIPYYLPAKRGQPGAPVQHCNTENTLRGFAGPCRRRAGLGLRGKACGAGARVTRDSGRLAVPPPSGG